MSRQGFRLAPQQSRLWPHLAENAPAFCAQVALEVSGRLDVERLARAVRRLAERHEVLRTAYWLRPGAARPLQVLEAAAPPELERTPAPDPPPAAGAFEPWLEGHLAELARAGFDLARGPVLRAVLTPLGEGRHLLVLGLPALAADGRSLGNLGRDLGRLYSGAELEPTVGYLQLSEWQNDLLEDPESEAERQLWRELLLGAPPARRAPLGVRGERAEDGGPAPGLAVCPLPGVGRPLRSLAECLGEPAAAVLLAAWQVLLWRHGGEDEGLVYALEESRSFDELEPLVGLVAKAIPIRETLTGGLRFGELAARAARQLARAGERSETFFPELFEDPSEVCPEVGFELSEDPPLGTGGDVSFRIRRRRARGEPFALKLAVRLAEGEVEAELQADPGRVDASELPLLAGRLEALLESLAGDPARRIGEADVLAAGERRRLLTGFNAGRPAAAGPPVHQLFEERARRSPESAAVRCGERVLSAAQLDAQASRLAHHLRASGVGPEAPVAVLLERSIELIVAIVAIHKAGGAFAILDPSWPRRRLAATLAECRAPVLVTRQPLVAGLEVRGAAAVLLDADAADIAARPATAPEPLAGPRHLAYVLFTSGTTGRPKAVMVEHAQLAGYTLGVTQALALPAAGSYALTSTPAADLGHTAIFPALVGGGCVDVIPAEGAMDPAALARHFGRHPPACMKIVPSHLAALLGAERAADLLPREVLVLGGESPGPELVRRARELRPQMRICNHYGPSETAVGVLTGPLGPWQPPARPALGRPLPGCRVFVLGGGLTPVPTGVPGELFVAGAGLSRGYLGRPGRTAASFLPDPFGPEGGGRLYRTGDRARHRADGELELLGRTDHQVKVRGFRVELGEVEAALRAYPGVREAVVLLREDEPGRQVLTAYAVAAPDGRGSVAELREHLAERLPEAMIPTAWVFLDRLPLSPNGKVDRAALPPPDPRAGAGETSGVLPRSLVEEMLADLWGEVLGERPRDVRASFFEVGGHSLLATQLISRARQAFQVDVALRDFFAAPTVEGLGELVTAAHRGGGSAWAAPITPVTRDEELVLSFAQERLWFMEQLRGGSSAYNVPRAVGLRGRLRFDVVERVFERIVARHEVLRTSLPAVEGRARVVIHEEVRLPIGRVDLARLPEPEARGEAERLLAEEARRPFDLARAPLLRVTVIHLEAEHHLAALTLHHIVSDAWSAGVLISELAELYDALVTGRAPRLPELPIQYADYAAWQRRWLSGAVLEEQSELWRRYLSGAPDVVLPTDKPRPSAPTFRAARVTQVVRSETLAELRKLGRREGVTLFMSVLAALAALIHRVTGREDVVVGTDVANRNRLEIERLIGFFINNLVLRADLSGAPSFRELLARVRRSALLAFAHQDMPFDQVVKALKAERDPNRMPLFQVLLVFQNVPRVTLELTGASLEPVEQEVRTAKFDVAIFVEERRDHLTMSWLYRTELFERATIERLAGQYLELLAGACAAPELAIGELAIETAAERESHAEERHARGRAKLRQVRRRHARL